ncbi:MAG: hypothetical protein Q4D24_04555 [Erysipelotrichaceae bacterium]|nr:hypothetical protein [Erysipelotrichaceae bacterium]
MKKILKTNIPNKQDLQDAFKKVTDKVDFETLKDTAVQATEKISETADKVKDAAASAKEDIDNKLYELDHMLEQSVTDYNDAFTQMNDKGIMLFVERSKAVDVIGNVETLINSIANHPKELDRDFADILMKRKQFTDSCEFAQRELEAARDAAGGAGAGLAAGATVAFMGPTVAMWVATTFGTASTGTAISTLSGAAATKAALAWLGGGALASGGGGVAAGNALLAMAGPIGWTLAGASLLSSILLFTRKRTKLNKQKNEEIEAVKTNTEKVKEMDLEIKKLLDETTLIKKELEKSFVNCLNMFEGDYSRFTADQKMKLGALVNNTKALSVMFERTIA